MTSPPPALVPIHSLLIRWHLSFHLVPVIVNSGTVDGVLVPLMARVVPVMVSGTVDGKFL